MTSGMYNNLQHQTCPISNLTSVKLSSHCLVLHYSLFFQQFRQNFSNFLGLAFLSRQVFLVLTVAVLLVISFSNHALTSKTANIIHGSAPYLTSDGGRTRVTDTDGLLGISLSNGEHYTPSDTHSSITKPIELPIAGQTFADIGMLVPTNTNSIALSSLIGTPYNYWGDDDGDGQGINDITATGSLNLTIVDKYNQAVARNEVLTICKSPYKLTLSNTSGTLKTRYGIPNESRFSASNATYYINPKATPVICFVKPNLVNGSSYYTGPANIWNPNKGFLTQSVTPSSYGLNFPTTGAHNLFFDLDIAGSNQALYWKAVSPNGDIKAKMSKSTKNSVRVTLTGPAVTDSSQQSSDNPRRIKRPSLPQTFELVGRDRKGNAVVKYGFVLKQWFVNRGKVYYTYSSTSSWCAKIGDYRVPKVKDLTNTTCQDSSSWGCQDAVGIKSSSPNNTYQRRIEAGFFPEWGSLYTYTGAGFGSNSYWTSDTGGNNQFVIFLAHGLCVSL